MSILQGCRSPLRLLSAPKPLAFPWPEVSDTTYRKQVIDRRLQALRMRRDLRGCTTTRAAIRPGRKPASDKSNSGSGAKAGHQVDMLRPILPPASRPKLERGRLSP